MKCAWCKMLIQRKRSARKLNGKDYHDVCLTEFKKANPTTWLKVEEQTLQRHRCG